MEKAKKPLRIFVVDDHRDIADGLAEVLRVHGHHVEVAYNGEQAVRIFREKDFDIAFMDVMMPGMNGVESFLAIRRTKPDAKVVMMTGYSVEQLLDQVVEKGAYGVLHKPVSMDDILDTLERVKSNGVVLIADSNQQFGASIKGVLEKNGYRTTVARTGKEALSKVLNGGVDILMLGQELPVLSGLEVYMEMRRRQRVVPTIIVTEQGKNYDSDLQNLHNFATTGILTKPFNTEQLLEALGRFSQHADSDETGDGSAGALEPDAAPPARYEAPAQPYTPKASGEAPRYAPPPQPHTASELAARAAEHAAEQTASGGYGSSDPTSPKTDDRSVPAATDGQVSDPTEPETKPHEAADYEADDFLPNVDGSAPAPSGLGAAAFSPEMEAPGGGVDDGVPTIDAQATIVEDGGVTEPAPTAPAEPAEMEIKGRIAVVDDDVDLADGLRDVLMTQGYEVRTAYSAAEAEQLISSFEAQIALLDIRLGKANGLDLILTLKEMRPDINCVMITGNSDKESAVTALKRGAFNYLSKPLHPQELFAVIENCLDKYFLDEQMRKAFFDLQVAKEAAEANSTTVIEFYEDVGQALDSLIETVRDGSSTMLEEAWGPLGAKPYVDNARSILECATRIDGILDIAGDLAKAKIGSLGMEEEEVDVTALLNNAADMVRKALGDEGGQEIHAEFAGEIPSIWGDERLLKAAIMNLLANSVEAAGPDGRITLSAERQGEGDLTVQVQDTRPGGAAAQTSDISKDGLGLALVAKVAELHGGGFNTDTPPGGGMSVSFNVPAKRIVQAASAA